MVRARPESGVLMRLTAENLRGERGGEQVFQGVRFDVGDGEALVITGPNGSGKSTLLRIVAGLLPSSGGAIRLEGGGEAWPDVASALQRLREAGIRLGFLSNMTEQMLAANIAHNGIGDLFECVISTDRAQAFKPAPQAYQLGVDAFGLPKENIAFAAFAGWDAAGAKWFGYPTVWVNRLDATAERLGAAPDKMTQDMGGLVAFALPSRSSIAK